MRQELRIESVAFGAEQAVLAAALDQVDPGDLVVYYRGPTGAACPAIKRAARIMLGQGLCYLTQRITGDRTPDGDRIVDYIAVKAKR